MKMEIDHKRDFKRLGWTLLCKLIGTGITYVIVRIVIANLPKILNIDIQLDSKIVFKLLIIGYILASLRSWAKDFLDAYYRRQYRWKQFWDMFPIYFLNYPILITSLYYGLSYLYKKQCFISGFLAFLSGFSVDYLWEQGNLLSIFKKIFRKDG